jgi:hypothetical protein
VDEYLMEYSNKLYKRIMPFIVENILKKIDDKYILEQRILSLNEKFLALSIKYHRDMKDNIVYINNSFIYNIYI